MNLQDPTNFWDVAAIFVAFAYYLTLLGGTVYVIQFWGWSTWWILIPLLSSVSVKTGRAAWKRRKHESVSSNRS